jgi:hypothetical protein
LIRKYKEALPGNGRAFYLKCGSGYQYIGFLNLNGNVGINI